LWLARPADRLVSRRWRAGLRSSYDYIVIGSGDAGSIVTRRLAERPDAQVLLLEAGGEDLKPGILITETWFFNQGGEFDWNFAAERSPSVNNRSIAQAEAVATASHSPLMFASRRMAP
jgi:choline dehydrogenase